MTLNANVPREPTPEPREPSPKQEAPNDKTPQNIERGIGERRNGSPPLREKHFAPGSTIFDEGEMGDVAYIIRSGKVEIRKGIQSSNPQRLAELGKGDVLGEMALFDDRPRMASAIALTDVKVIEMSKEEFQERLSTMDPAMKGIALTMVTRVRNMANEVMRRKADTNWTE